MSISSASELFALVVALPSPRPVADVPRVFSRSSRPRALSSSRVVTRARVIPSRRASSSSLAVFASSSSSSSRGFRRAIARARAAAPSAVAFAVDARPRLNARVAY
jgi:hypothetical protein